MEIEPGKRGMTVFLFLASFLFSVLPAIDPAQSGMLTAACVAYAVICAVGRPAIIILQPVVSFALCLLLTQDVLGSLFTILSYTVVGAICGFCFGKKVPFQKAAFYASLVAAVVSVGMVVGGVYLESGILTGETLALSIKNGFQALAQPYTELLSAQEVMTASQIKDLIGTAQLMYIRFFPAIIVLSALLKGAVTAALCGLIGGWLYGMDHPMKKIQQLRLSPAAAVFFLISLLTALFADEMVGMTAGNLAIIIGAPLLLQGLFCIAALWKRLAAGMGCFLYVGVLWLLVVMNTAVAAALLAILGGVDCFIDLRKPRPSSEK